MVGAMKKAWVGVVCGVLAAAGGAGATPIGVGTGDNRAEVYIEFGDGATYTFEVAFDDIVNGMELLDIVEAHEPLTTVRSFGGMFLDGITYDGHSNIGYDGGENWWHYWTRDGGGEWFAPQAYGALDREVHDGSSDGWIYGRDGAPLPEPGTVLLSVAGMAFALRRRRVRGL